MSLNNISQPTPSGDTSNWGDTSSTGDQQIRDAVVRSTQELSSTVSSTVNSLFAALSDEGDPDNYAYLRGMQLLHAYGISSIATAYWEEGENSLAGITSPIQNTVLLRELESTSSFFSDIKDQLRKMLASTTIDRRIIDLVKEETRGFGGMSEVLEAVLLFFVLLGETNSGKVRL